VALHALSLLTDERGSFVEAFRGSWFPAIPPFVQGNLSRSRARVLRGLHVHRRQWDLWVPVAGRLFVALRDLREGSPTAGVTDTLELDAARPAALLIPPGVAHGFQALEDATLLYLVTEAYDGTDEDGFSPLDPAVGVSWPLDDPILSDRDRDAPPLAELEGGRGQDRGTASS
jgi:dTDP-4-dehydrorhamnose 3,5-epimerase